MKIYKLLINISLPFIFLLLFSLMSTTAIAQERSDEKHWNFLTEIYLVFVNMEGETGIGNNLSAPVNAGTSDIFGALKLGGMVYLEANTNKWAITSDFVFMNLEKEITPTMLISSGTAGTDQYIWELGGLYRINSFWEAGLGSRLTSLAVGLDGSRNTFPNNTEEFSESSSKTFVDPIIITRLSTTIHDKWLLQFRGDVGGFGVGSDLTWQVQAYAGYRFSKLFQITAGYRIISIDYDKGENSDRFVFDMNEFGPVVRFGFNF